MASAFHVHLRRAAFRRPITVRRIEPRDCLHSLALGLEDVLEAPTCPLSMGFFYTLAGIAILSLAAFAHALELALPLAAGFALLGPFAAIGIYEMSRRREEGFDATLRDAFSVLKSPALPSILALGFLLFVLFAAWVAAAELLYMTLYGHNPPQAAFLTDALTAGGGWLFILASGAIGLCFAALALCVGIVSFPLMIDRGAGLVPAMEASLAVSRGSPLATALWGLAVAVLLFLGSLPLFIGLAVVMPMLGHATWRLYRRAIERDPAAEIPIEI